MPKANFMILDTDYSGVITKGEIINGKVLLKRGNISQEFFLSIPKKDANGKEYYEDVKPIYLRGIMGGTKPLYILKWNSLYPVAFEVKRDVEKYTNDKGEVMEFARETLEPVKIETKDTMILPELLAETHDLRFLKSMKKVQSGTETDARKILMIIGIFLLLIGGGFLIYKLFLG